MCILTSLRLRHNVYFRYDETVYPVVAQVIGNRQSAVFKVTLAVYAKSVEAKDDLRSFVWDFGQEYNQVSQMSQFVTNITNITNVTNVTILYISDYYFRGCGRLHDDSFATSRSGKYIN